jgi:malonyl-CoA/methylmalonyl-CoA synthetase
MSEWPDPRVYGSRTAVVDAQGSHTHDEWNGAASRVASALLRGRADLAEARIAFLVEPGARWVAVQWGIWRAGGIAVPLALSHPPPELAYVLDDASVDAVVSEPQLADRLSGPASERAIPLLDVETLLACEPVDLPLIESDRRAMILYTSGTTSRPKGAVTTHANIAAQVASLVKAWAWSADDRILCVLPLHHVHGIVNVVACALSSGACCVMHARFDAERVWAEFAKGELTLFMAVPTIYARLIAAWEAAGPAVRERWSAGCRAMRLMVSGSAALPVSTLERWRDISGHTLLERYGMTEIGMALSNPLAGQRRPGFVGSPLPGLEARIVDDAGHEVSPGTPGEIEVRGPSVFREYWNRPEETRAAFRDGWFRTGDIAVIEDGAWRILGRSSVDVLKVGGHKVSALEIEEALRAHPDVVECAVVGVDDEEWGQRVCAAIVSHGGSDAHALREWLLLRLGAYKVPARFCFVEELPRNAMGKVLKAEVGGYFAEGGGTWAG